MRTKLPLAAVLTAALAAGFAGCEGAHKPFVEQSEQKKNWDLQQMNINYQVAEQQYRVGDLDKCRESLKQALAINAPYAPIHVLAAKVEMEGGSLDEAIAQLKKALTIKPADPEPLFLLGVVYQRVQKFDTALDYYRQACEKNANEARYALAVAEMEIALNQLDHAKLFLEDKLNNFEQSPAMHIALGRIATLQDDPARAARCYRDATLLAPEDKNVRWFYASALFDAGRYSDAARILEDMRDDPPAPPKASSAYSSKVSEAVKAADAEAEAATAISAKVSLVMMLGECYVNLKRPVDARDCFQEVLRLQPANVSAYLSLGKTSLLADDFGMTVSAAQKVLRLEPDNVNALILLAAAQEKQKNWTDAQGTLVKAARLAPKDSTILCLQGLAALQLGQKDAATAYFTRAVALNPTDTWATSLLEQVKPGAAAPAPAAPAETPAVPAAKAMDRASLEPAPLSVPPAAPAALIASPESPARLPDMGVQHP